jgi:hypothetical protein
VSPTISLHTPNIVNQIIFLLLLDINHVWHLGLAAIMLFRPTHIFIYNLVKDDLKMSVHEDMFVIQYHF